MLTEKTALGCALEVVSIALADAGAFFASSPHAEMVEPPDIDTTTRFVLAMGTESVRLIREDLLSEPEEATLAATWRLATGNDPQGVR